MNWQEKRTHHRQSSRLLTAVAALSVLFSLAFLVLFKDIVWQEVADYFNRPKEDFPLAPIPKNDPIIVLSELLAQKNIPIQSSPVATGSAVLVDILDNGQVFFSRTTDIPSQVDSLQIILTRLTIEGKQFKSIDFRYEKPIITLAN